MADVDVVIEDDRWQALDLEGLAGKAVQIALETAGVSAADYEICVMGCSDTRIADLNAEFRGKPAPTNVLSWPALDVSPDSETGIPPAIPVPCGVENSLGDIAIAFETCEREALEKGIPVADHVVHLVVHGCLHLLGYDHLDEVQAGVMEGLEIKALASMGLDNPY